MRVIAFLTRWLTRRSRDSPARPGAQRGHSSAMMATAIGAMLIAGVLVMDVGLAFGERVHARAAEDFAALAAAQELPESASDPDVAAKWVTAETTAIDYLRSNGYAVADADVSGGATANYGGNFGQIEVRVDRTRSWSLGSLFGLGDLLVCGRAVAEKQVSDGYALFASNSSCGPSDGLDINGSVNAVVGAVHSNSDLSVSGSNNDFQGDVTYSCSLSVGGGGNTFSTPPALTPSEPPPISYAYADFPCDYSYSTPTNIGSRSELWVGNDPSSNQLKTAVICSTSHLTLSGSDVTGTVTLVARGNLNISGSNFDLTPYWQNVLLFSSSASPQAIDLSGSGGTWRGYINTPIGRVKLAGSSNLTLETSIVADQIQLSGSDLSIDSSNFGGVSATFLVE